MFDTKLNTNIYSGHDYTILSVIGSLQLIDKLKNAPNFGCFLIFELWDTAPPQHASTSKIEGTSKIIGHDCSCKPARVVVNDVEKNGTPDNCYHKDILLYKPVEADSRILRILLNSCPIGTMINMYIHV